MDTKKASLGALSLLLVLFVFAIAGSLSDETKTNNLAAVSGSGSGLSAHWLFDAGSGTAASDASGNGNTANFVGTAGWTTGKSGSSIVTDGSGYAKTDTSISLPSTFSVSAWVKISEAPAIDSYEGRLVENSYAQGFAMHLNHNVNGTFATWTTGGQPIYSNSSLVTGQWVHITGTYNNGDTKLYVNGVLETESNVSAYVTVNPTNLPIHFGTYFGSPGNLGGFKGALDDVRIYNRALAASEVSEIYALGGTGTDNSGNSNPTPTPTPAPTVAPTPNPSDTTAPVVSGVSSSGVSSSGATVSWTTDEASDTQVEYGLTTAYGNLTSLNSSLVTSHSQAITGLLANTLYHYRARSKDASSNIAIGSDNTFTTSALGLSTFTLTVTKSGSGTVSGGSISCGSACSLPSIVTGTSITLTAVPDTGYTFSGWSGGCTGTGSCSLTITGNSSVTATFSVASTGKPETPSILAGKSISGDQINLSWPASLGTVVAVKYNVYRNNSLVGSVNALPEERQWKDAGMYQDLGLSPNTSYTYHVKAVSSGGTESDASPSFTVSTLSSSENGLIPSSRLTDWTPGVRVGVPGGIPKRTNVIDITQGQYGADKTGASDASGIINTAITNAPKDAVIYLPAGKYLLSSPLYITRSDISVRGDGMDITVLDCRSTCVVLRGQDVYNLPIYGVTSGAFKGSTQISFAADASVGDLVKISTRNDPKLPVISPSGYEGSRHHNAVIKSKSGNTYGIFPPIIFDVDSSNTQVEIFRPINFIGLEDMTMDATIGRPQTTLGMSGTYGSWIKNVRVKGASNYLISMGDNLFCELRHSYVDTGKAGGTNGAGFLAGNITGCLVEDNIMLRSFPVIEINFGSTGNVFAYNLLTGDESNTNHGSHNSYNLYEGNVADTFKSDGYYGGESETTFFRNYVTGFGYVLKRFSRNFSIVGNQLNGGHSFGQPNIGNPFFNGEYAAPSAGVYWKDWNLSGPGVKATLVNRISDTKGQFNVTSGMDRLQTYCPTLCLALGPDWGNSSNWNKAARYSMSETSRSGSTITLENGYGVPLPPQGTQLSIWPRSEGFQELDLDVPASTLLRGNWYRNGTYRSGLTETLNGNALPNSLYLSSKPAWFGTMTWPPFGPQGNQNTEAIPAAYRYKYGGEAPGVIDTSGSPPPTTVTLTVVKEGVGSGTVSGTGINCGADCTEGNIARNSTVTLTATASTGSTFTGWSGGGCSGTQATCTVTMSTNQTVTANFGPIGATPIPATPTPAPTPAPDTTAPTVTITSPTNNGTLTGSVSIAATASDNVGIVGVQWKLDGSNLGTELTTAPYSGTWNTSGVTNGVHTLTATARDAAGNTKTATVSVTVTNIDTTAPSQPTGLTTSALTDTALTVSWTASTDNVGVTGYRVYRNGSLIASVATNFYAVTGLTANTAYSFTVSAFDAQGNVSLQSAPTSATTAPVPVPTYTVTISKTGEGTVTGTGISCGNICQRSVTKNDVMDLKANPNAGHTFAAWGGICGGKGACNFTVTANQTIIATFVPDPSYSSSNNPSITPKTGILTPTVPQRPPVVPSTGLNLTRDLSQGSTGSDVRSLQEFLNNNGFTIATTGPGSKGQETTSFGSLTKVAVIKFQAKYGISQTGYVGPQTRAKILSLGGGTTQTTTVTTTSNITSSSFKRDLTLGSTGEDVRALQKFLNSKGYTVASSGPGSKGLETAFFGPATQRALANFQRSNGIAPSVGYFGPLTRTKVGQMNK